MKFYLNSLLVVLIILTVSCKKESTAKNEEPYIASPGRVIDLIGSNWADNEHQFSNKQDYLYTKLQNDISGSSGMEATISLSAVEKTFPDVAYNMLMNVAGKAGTGPMAGNIAIVSIVTKGSLHSFPKEKAYDLMLFYYNEGLSLITDTVYTYSGYVLQDSIFINTTQKEVIEKLNSGYNSSKFIIGYRTISRGDFMIELTKDNEQTPYYFSFYSYKL